MDLFPLDLIELNNEDKSSILKVAKKTIAYAMRYDKIMPIEIESFSDILRTPWGLFVTIETEKNTNIYKSRSLGSKGSVKSTYPLIKGVVEYSYGAGFKDERFYPLNIERVENFTLNISICSIPLAINCSSDMDIIRQLVPYKDGILLEVNDVKSSFSPNVWKLLPRAKDFWLNLRKKANLRTGVWSDSFKISRYYTVELREDINLSQIMDTAL